ncbi:MULTISPECIES: hypothetical protein [Klebsiella pneumoniae complex]|uniref:hypothetical protein n=1 Tax=Klebsiella pneumoniae complex TaxID=3390273 RepID=UPI000C1F7B20|nr:MULTISPECIES: hypothetical protein [Klebsiella]HCK1663670.1 hypothetical protein [Escherichia coli]EIX9213067.1 hypothetical protein [Klebsiella pneumoniae]EIX9373565.1 hypothetical protein [Klebsiella pneumoniae]MEA4345455.1 hypothetical protein [Klebsiella pneumoniae]PZX84680.1 hypothetical protein DMR06_20110 [Klebsiella pneumoniae]
MEVYKYFKKKSFKEDYLNGKIRLGTLAYYRGIENVNQGDPLEGLTKYKVPYQEFDKAAWDEVIKVQPQFAQIVEVAEGGIVTMANCETESYCHDEYIVCATSRRDDEFFKNDFGEFCIKIEQPELFCDLVAKHLSTMFRRDVRFFHKPVSYTKVELTNFLQQQDPVFTKPRFPYEPQSEFRFFWLMNPLNDSGKEVITVDIGEHWSEHLFTDIK